VAPHRHEYQRQRERNPYHVLCGCEVLTIRQEESLYNLEKEEKDGCMKGIFEIWEEKANDLVVPLLNRAGRLSSKTLIVFFNRRLCRIFSCCVLCNSENLHA